MAKHPYTKSAGSEGEIAPACLSFGNPGSERRDSSALGSNLPGNMGGS